MMNQIEMGTKEGGRTTTMRIFTSLAATVFCLVLQNICIYVR